jgi:hypothetical protein
MIDATLLTIQKPGQMKPQDGNLCGQTGFYRYPHFQPKLIDALYDLPPQDEIRILIVPGSIGCEAVTLGILADRKKLTDKHKSLVIHSVDLSKEFTEVAVRGLYSPDAIKHLPRELLAYFENAANPNSVKPSPAALRNITYLPSQGLMDIHTDKPYDAVICANLLQWILQGGSRRRTIAHMKKLCNLSLRFLCATLHFRSYNDANGLNTGGPFIENGFHLLGSDWKPLKGKITRASLDHMYGHKDPWEHIYVFSR